MAKYLDPKADVTFKKVFGEHKNLVISLLNALLPLDDGKQVEAIEYLPPEMVPETPLGKNTIRESGLNDVERAAYEGFWDRVSIETTKKAYEDRLVAERDAANAERDAAIEKMRQDKLDTARQMKADGLPVETIAKYTGLTADEIKAL